MFTRRITTILCVLVAIMFMAATASASDIELKFTNNSGNDRTDLHVFFNHSVGATTGVSGYNPPFTTVVNNGTNVIEFSDGTVAWGDSTGCIVFHSNASGLTIDSAKWTPGPVDIDLREDVTVCSAAVPSLTEYGLLVLAILIVMSAAWIMWRRRRLTVAA